MTHIVIKLDHEPFEVTRESIKSLPEWCPVILDLGSVWKTHEAAFLSSKWGDYLVSCRSKIEVWPPEDVERYIKNPYEECAKVTEVEQSCALSNHGHGKQIAQAIRQLEKECGK